jgi:hypothetical protein
MGETISGSGLTKPDRAPLPARKIAAEFINSGATTRLMARRDGCRVHEQCEEPQRGLGRSQALYLHLAWRCDGEKKIQELPTQTSPPPIYRQERITSSGH